jgi:hypothetical protein
VLGGVVEVVGRRRAVPLPVCGRVVVVERAGSRPTVLQSPVVRTGAAAAVAADIDALVSLDTDRILRAFA